MTWLVLATAIVTEVGATVALRASDGFRKKVWIVPAVVGFLTSFCLLWLTLSFGVAVGIVYGIWTACGVALVAVVARFLFGDPLTPKMAVGMGFIMAGVLTIELVG